MKKLFEPHDWETCSSCGVARNLGNQCDYCGTAYTDTVKRTNTKSSPASLSSKYQISQRDGELRISWRWADRSVLYITLFLIPFFIFWNLIWIKLLFSMYDTGFLAFSPFFAFHAVVGILGPLYVLTRWVNRTTIIANKRHLIVKKHPIPWGRKRKFRADEIKQLFVSRKRKSSKKGARHIPELQLVTENGTRHRLLTGSLLTGKGEVEFTDYESLCQHLSHVLDIETVSALGAVSN